MPLTGTQVTWVSVAALGVVAVVLVACTGGGRPGSTTGTIVSKTFREASTTTSYPHGANRGFKTPTTIPIAASYSLELDAEGLGRVRATVNTVQGEQLSVGDKVTVRYVVRGLPVIWKRTLVSSVEKITPP